MKTLLLVEDEFHIQDIYRLAFVKTGRYTVETASDGQEALVKLRAHVYDLILLDIMLPKVTGIDVLRAMRAPTSPTRNTPIILITNLGQEDIIKEAFKIGADGYLIKAQFTPQDVVTEVDAFFEQMEQVKQTAQSQQNDIPNQQTTGMQPDTTPGTTSPTAQTTAKTTAQPTQEQTTVASAPTDNNRTS